MTWFGVAPQGLDMYHVGVVVPDVRAAMAAYGEALGFTFSAPGDSRLEVLVDGVRRECRISATYSQQGPPYLELVEERSGGVWATAALGLQHVGFWTDDLEGSRRRLDETGFPCRVVHAPADGTPGHFCYHEAAPGLWWELVSTSFQPRLEARRNQPPDVP